ncbi:DUF433 domain-containing protein [Candidatus Harpocratesius sp.]
MSKRIIIDPSICVGKPCIKGTRLPVDFILELLAQDWSYDQIQEEYDITKEDILAVLHYATKSIREERIFKIEA